MKIIVGAVLSRYPFVPGSVWNRLNRVLGLQRLGHDVYVVEELSPKRCVDRAGRPCGFHQSVNRDLFAATIGRFGLMDHACQIFNRGEDTCGLSLPAIAAVAKDADLFINMSGHVSTEVVLCNVNRRVYIDEDPVYTQLWHAEYGVSQDLHLYHAHFTVGLNIGTPRCVIPDCDVQWRHTLPPVTLDYWPFQVDPSCRRFTTIASWTDFGDLCHKGVWHRSKAEEFRRLAELPRRVAQELEVALGEQQGMDSGSQTLRQNGWVVTDGRQIADLESYQAYIGRSRAEIGVAKNAYVQASSGWFSDRSAHYLACGKPVLAQSTGFEHALPTGRGLLTFHDIDEAVAGIEAVNADYASHCRAARDFAEAHLDYRKVLPAFLEACVA